MLHIFLAVLFFVLLIVAYAIGRLDVVNAILLGILGFAVFLAKFL
jgi:hypothetical protein